MLNNHTYVMGKQEKLFYTIAAFIAGGLAGLLFYGGLFKSQGEATSLTTVSNIVVFVAVGLFAV